MEVLLLQQAQAGDQAAWQIIVTTHQQAVFRLAYLLLRNAAAAEDVAQETFIRAFRKLHLYDQQRPLRPWLLQITTNLARNQQRSLRRYLALLQRWRHAQPPAAALDDSTERRWQAQQVHAAIARLRHIDQEVLYLRFFLDLSETEMAQVLGIAPGTVKSRLHRASARLRTCIEQHFGSLLQDEYA